MRVKIFVFTTLFFMLLANASAGSTIVNLKTLPHHTVFLTPIATGGGYTPLIPHPLQGFSSKYGDVKFGFDLDELTYDLNILIKEDENILHSEKIRKNFIANTEIKVTSLPAGVEAIETPEPETYVKPEPDTNITENSTNKTEIEKTITKEEIKEKQGIILSGYTIIEKNQPIIHTIYYSLITLIGLFIIFMIFKEKKKKNQNNSYDSKGDEFAIEREINKTKQKLNELENKKKQKIEEIKRQLTEDQRRLMRLRGQEIQNKKHHSHHHTHHHHKKNHDQNYGN